MKRQRTQLLITLLVWLAGCGEEDNPLRSDSDTLIGTWNFESTNLAEVLVQGYTVLLNSLKLPQHEIGQRLAEFREEIALEGPESDLEGTITFKPDHTFVDDEGDGGTWTTDNGKLILQDDETRLTFTCSLSEQRLALSLTWKDFRAQMGEAPQAEDQDTDTGFALFDTYIPAGQKIQFFFRSTP